MGELPVVDVLQLAALDPELDPVGGIVDDAAQRQQGLPAGVVELSYVGAGDLKSHPCYRKFRLEAYIGAPLYVEGRPYGTLNFSSPAPRRPFTEGERMLLQICAEWTGARLEEARVEKALRESESRFRSMVAHAPGAFFRSRLSDGVLVYVSDGIRQLGFEHEDLIGAHLTGGPWPFVDPTDWAKALPAIEHSVRTGEPYLIEYRVRRTDGAVRWWREEARPAAESEGGALVWLDAFIVDITESKQAAEELERRVAERTAEVYLLDRAIAAATNGIVVTDPAKPGNPIVFVNAAFEKLTGYSAAEAVGRSCRFLQNDDRDQPSLEELRAAVRDGRAASVVLRNYRKDGRLFWNALRIAPVRNDAGDLTHFVGIQTDITEERKKDERLAQTQKIESLGQLTGGIAHDFNNLLTVIMGNLELLTQELKSNERLRTMAAMAGKAADRGQSLTQQLLAFSRRQSLEPQVVNPSDILNDMRALLRRTIDASIRIEFALDPQTRPIRVDQGQFQTAVLNLVVNARDAVPSGGEITLQTASTTVSADQIPGDADVEPGPFTVISVSDTGSGIEPSVLARVFEPFFTTKEKGRGTGLGLSMVYGFVRQSGGFVQISSELGRGTVVKLYFPRTEAELEASAAVPLAATETGPANILLVEDDPDVREVSLRMLHLMGHRVHVVANGAEAIALLQRKVDIDLVFTDVVMPGGVSGIDVGGAARKLRPGVLILYASGYSDHPVIREHRMRPDESFIPKPFRLNDLSRAISALLLRRDWPRAQAV